MLWLTTVNRTSPELPATLVFTDVEIELLKHLVPTTDESDHQTTGDFLIRLARLGGYLNRKWDAPPGNTVLWRGMARLTDIHLGFSLAKVVGNRKVGGTDTYCLTSKTQLASAEQVKHAVADPVASLALISSSSTRRSLSSSAAWFWNQSVDQIR